MILTCNYEEWRALVTGADLLLSGTEHGSHSAVAAPAEALAAVELLRPRLGGALSISTLAEQRSLRSAVAVICDELHDRMEAKLLEFHPAHEEVVSYYFDYAHALSVLGRLDEMGAEMSAMLELMTGEAPSSRSSSDFTFPD